MVTFNRSTDLPSSIVTVEQNAAWSLRVLYSVAPSLLITEVAGSSPELVVSSNPFPVLSDPNDYHTRLIQRCSFRLQDDWDSKKLWLAVNEISTNPIPAYFKLP
jgi:hypothetical protein